MFVLFVLECFTPDLSGVLNLTERLELAIPQRMLTIYLSRKLDMSIKRSAVSQKGFPFLIRTLKT